MFELQAFICANTQNIVLFLHFVWFTLFGLFLFWEETSFSKMATLFLSAVFLALVVFCNATSNLALLNKFLFCFALAIVAVFDATEFMIPRICTLGLIPVWFVSSYFGFLSINLCQSGLAMGLGYSIFFVLNKIFYLKNGENGLGVGDMELAAMIGSFFGTMNLIYSVNVSTILALVFSLLFAFVSGKGLKTFKIPYGFFLASGSVFYFLLQNFTGF